MDIKLTNKSKKLTPKLISFFLLLVPLMSWAGPPVGNFDVYYTEENNKLDVNQENGVLRNDSDPDGEQLTIESISSLPNHGTLTWSSDGAFTYTPIPNYHGTDIFRYVVSDGNENIENVLVVLSISPSDIPKTSDKWSTFGNDTSHTGYQKGFLGDNLDILLWQKDFIDASSNINQVAISQSQLYVTFNKIREETYILALNSQSGAEVWRKDLDPANSISSVSFENGNVYFQRSNHSDDSQLWSLNSYSGFVNWRASYGAQWDKFFAPTVSDNRVWINGGHYGGLYGFNQNTNNYTGEQLFFEPNLPQTDSWSPLYHNGKLYSYVRGLLNEHNLDTGEIIRTLDAGWDFDSYSQEVVAVARNEIAYLQSTTHITAVDLNSFTIKWQHTIGQKGTPAIADDLLYVISDSKVNLYDAVTGEYLLSYETSEPIIEQSQPLITDDRLIVSSASKVFVFNRFDTTLLKTIDEGGLLSLADGVLYISSSNKLSAWKLGYRTRKQETDSAPIIKQPIEDMVVNQGAEPISINLLDIFSDPDELLNFSAKSSDTNGLVSTSIIGNELILNIGEFEGESTITVIANSFGQTVEISFVVKVENKDIIIQIFDSEGKAVSQGQPLTGVVTGKVTFINKKGQHAQFYQNFRTLPINESSHMIHSDHWERTFSVNTASFYDGENLISVHVHPTNTEGQPYVTKFSVGQFKIVASNNNPAPNGDTLLPSLQVDKTKFVISPSASIPGHVLDTLDGAFIVNDDLGVIDIDQDSNSSNEAQVIPHLGASVLGRFRWLTASPPWGEDFSHDILGDVHLINFQQSDIYRATLVLFLNDSSGRANYGFYSFDVPNLSDEDRGQFTLPTLDSDILNVSQGQEIILPEGEDFTIQVQIDVSEAMAEVFPMMSTWIGNRSVAKTDLQHLIENMDPDESLLIVDIKIPEIEIEKLQNSRQGGNDSVAFAIWNDFAQFGVGLNSHNLPSSEHVHVSMIRTSDIDGNFTDADNDGVLDAEDNCPNNYNPSQLDSNNDGIGDVCYGNPINLAESHSLGEHFIGGETSIKDGFSLYVFADDLGQSNSVCVESCQQHWPPLIIKNEQELSQITHITNLSTSTRDDGSLQVTHNGKPLYFYASDLGGGDTSGHGVNNKWWLAVTNPPGDFQWSSTTLSISENINSFEVELTRDNGNSGEVSVDIHSIAGSANDVADFLAVDERVIFLDGETSKNVTISIINDSEDERNETFSLELSNASDGSMIVESSIEISITDDDQPSVNTGENASSNESGGGGSLNFLYLIVVTLLLSISQSTKGFRKN